MSRQEAAVRRRHDPRAAFAVGAWTVLLLAAAVVLSWRVGQAEFAQVSSPALCAGVTLAALLGLAAHMTYHAARFGARRRRGELAAFLLSLLPPFVPAAAFAGGQSVLATIYLSGLFVVAFIAAWVVGDESGFSRYTGAARLRRAQSSRANLTAEDRGRREENGGRRTEGGEWRADLGEFGGAEGGEPTRLSSCYPPSSLLPPPSVPPPLRRADAAHPGPPEPTIAQWMTRTKSAGGGERIEGSIHVEFAPGQKQVMVHLPFVPPFSRPPEIDCCVADECRVRVKVGTVQTYGARLEARRPEPADEPLDVDIIFSAAVAVHSDAA